MEKTVQLLMPNEPLKQSVSDGNTVDITYTGRQYLIVSHNKSDNVVQCVEARFDTLAECILEDYIDDRTNFHILDANIHTAMAAYLTEEYTNAEVDDFEETLGTGEIYNYPYIEEGIIDVIWSNNDFVYDEVTKDYSAPTYHEPITQEQWDQCLVNQNEWIASIDTSALNETHAAEMATYTAFFADIETTYAGVDYWKIPLPRRPIVD
tara:strand:+ start:248 stop:871 length:624 start_codon:yes stop_codon:yes gene_type:complete